MNKKRTRDYWRFCEDEREGGISENIYKGVKVTGLNPNHLFGK